MPSKYFANKIANNGTAKISAASGFKFFITANKIWKTIINPVTSELIKGMVDLSDASVFEIKDSEDIVQDKYYISLEKETNSDIPLRRLHNYIKHKLISSANYDDMTLQPGDDREFKNQFTEFLQKNIVVDEPDKATDQLPLFNLSL